MKIEEKEAKEKKRRKNTWLARIEDEYVEGEGGALCLGASRSGGFESKKIVGAGRFSESSLQQRKEGGDGTRGLFWAHHCSSVHTSAEIHTYITSNTILVSPIAVLAQRTQAPWRLAHPSNLR